MILTGVVFSNGFAIEETGGDSCDHPVSGFHFALVRRLVHFFAFFPSFLWAASFCLVQRRLLRASFRDLASFPFPFLETQRVLGRPSSFPSVDDLNPVSLPAVDFVQPHQTSFLVIPPFFLFLLFAALVGFNQSCASTASGDVSPGGFPLLPFGASVTSGAPLFPVIPEALFPAHRFLPPAFSLLAPPPVVWVAGNPPTVLGLFLFGCSSFLLPWV